MSAVPLTFAGAAEIARRVAAGEVSARAVAEAFIARIAALDPAINSFITVLGDRALDQAARRACKPIDDKRGTIEYRIKVAGVMTRRAATIAYERARANS